MWITSREYQKMYNISPQLFYLQRTTNKIKTKELVKGHYFVEIDDNEDKEVIVCGRVSTSKQKK